MEFIIFLSKIDKEIIDLLIKANYIVEENKIECLLNKEIKGLHNLVENKIIICTENAGGIKINTNVMPFIIRGVKLWGIDSSGSSIKRREFVWGEAAKLIDISKVQGFTKELTFSGLLDTYPKLLKGEFFGRAIVNPNK